MTAQRHGLQNSYGGRKQPTEFRTTMTEPAGLHKTDIFMGRVINVNHVNWTVDVVSQFEQMRLLDIQVASPYQHSNRGEGIYVVPEVGSKCVVCWPGDGSPPFVMAFVMPHEVDTSVSEDAPAGTTARATTTQSPVDASFAGGRPRSKGGDMMMRGRDGNYVVLHRGGVLQLGANELSQRVYIPMNNLIMDFCENYAMHNSGGTIRWGLQEGEGSDDLPTEMTETFRVKANDKYGDVRVSVGKVHAPVPDTDTGITEAGVGVDKKSPVVFEFAFAKNGFKPEDGSNISQTGSLLKLRFVFDRDGNAHFRVDGNVYMRCRKRLRLKVDKEIVVEGGTTALVTIQGSGKMTFGGTLELTAPVFIFNGGKRPAAFMGGLIQVVLPPTILMANPASPSGFSPVVPPFNVCAGTIVDGEPSHLI